MGRTPGAKNKTKPDKPKKPAKAKPKAKETAPKKGPAQAAAAPTSGQVRKVITQNNLKILLEDCGTHKTRADSHNGKLREAIAQAVQHQHLNKKVFGLIRQLDKLEPETLLVYLEDLEHYLDISGLNDRADSVGKLPLGQADDGEEPETGDSAEEGPPTKILPADTEVSKPQGIQVGQAPGGTVHMLPDRKAAAAAN